jgi:hypothetical protein
VTATIETPTIRVAARRSRFWILAAVFLVIIAIIVLAITGAGRAAGAAYSATNAGPAGSKAIAQVLQQHGVDVTVADSLAATRAALSGSTPSTLMLVDPNNYLDDRQLSSVAALAQHVVLLAPTFSQLARLTPGVEQAGAVTNKPLTAGCSLVAARQAGTVTGTGLGYRDTTKDGSALSCFNSGRSTYSVIDITHAGRSITVVGTTAAFTNEHVAEHGNAALALNVLGDNPRLVWYLPTIDDVAGVGKPTIAQLTPPWVSPVIVLLIITAIAAAVWRGRRMGPLIVENLPVVVRSSETMEGRARLYQRGSARLRALDALRIGAVTRLAATCGLSRLATTTEIVSAVASVTGEDERGIRSLLLDDVPRTDRELVARSDALLRLERRTADAVRPQQQIHSQHRGE